MKKRYIAVLACLTLASGFLAIGAGQAAAAPPAKTFNCHGEGTIDNQGGTGLGPYTVVITATNNCAHMGVEHFVRTHQTFVNLPIVFCAAPTGLGVSASTYIATHSTAPNGSELTQTGGPNSVCLAISPPPPPTGIVSSSNVETLHVVSASRNLDNGQVGCDVTVLTEQTINFDVSPPTVDFENHLLSVAC